MKMRKYLLKPCIILFVVFSFQAIFSQADTVKYNDIKVIVPKPEKKKSTTCLLLSGGYQVPEFYNVPMVPVTPGDLKVKGDMQAEASGWFAGAALIKRTGSHFEAGIEGSFFRSSVPVAFAGEQSKSAWVFQNNGNDSLTGIFNYEIDRTGDAIVIRALIRYKIPVGNFRIWIGAAPGTFSSKVYFLDKGSMKPSGSTFRATSPGVSFQAGLDYVIKNQRDENVLLFSMFSDFSGPRINESMFSLFNKPNWRYSNQEGNYVVNPFRIGFAIGFH
jgi:hypothetical protein